MKAHPQPGRRVVVTGMGCVSPLGNGAVATWEAAVQGRSGIAPITSFDTTGFPVTFAGEVKGELDLGDLNRKDARRIDRVIALALDAAQEALGQSGLVIDDDNRERVGVAIGTGSAPRARAITAN